MTNKLSRSVYGYPMVIKEKENHFIVEIKELGVKGNSENKGRAIRNVFDEVKRKVKEESIKPKSIPEKHLKIPQNLQIRMFEVNQIITDFGFAIIADDINDNDMSKIEQICINIDSYNENEIEERQEEIEKELIKVFEKYVLNPRLRALTMNSLIMNTEHIKKYSHIIEQGYISLFREEYISTVMILTPIIEGVLLSLFDFDPKEEGKPKEKKLLNKWAELEYMYNKKQMIHPFMVDEYIRAFLDIWTNIIFASHQEAEDNLYFNRHYITHLMGEGEFYSKNNAFKLIILIDLLSHVLAACYGQHSRFHFDTDNSSFQFRQKCYSSIFPTRDEGYSKLMEEHE